MRFLMKNFILFGLCLFAIESHAMSIEEFYEEAKGDLSAFISRPSLGGPVPISSKSDHNGVCKSFGYERAALGAITLGSAHRGPMINIGPDGKIRGGEILSETSGLTIDSIICLNKVSTRAERTILVTNPDHDDSRSPYSSRSDQIGVCKSLGFYTAAVGSAMFSRSRFQGLLVIVGPDGKVTGGEVATGNSGFKFDKIVCINPVAP
jgi:hypothetical protein